MRWLRWGLVGTFLLLTGAGLALDLLAGPSDVSGPEGLLNLLAAAVPPALGALIAARRPANPIGWLLLAVGVAIALGFLTYGYARYAVARPGTLPATGWVSALGELSWLAFAIPITLLLLWFPDGRSPGPRWRPVGVLAMAGMLAGSVGAVLATWSGLFEALRAAGTAAVIIAAVGSVASLLVRYRRAGPEPRQQLKWLFWTAALLVAAVLVGNLVPGMRYGQSVLTTLVIDLLLQVGLPVAVAIAILRHRLYDIDVLIRRSVVYSALWALITAAYVAVAWFLGMATTGRVPIELAILLTVLATVAFQPLRRRLDRFADRLVFGRRRSGYGLVSDLGAAVGGIDDPAELAARIAALVREGLHLQGVRVRLAGLAESPVDGSPPDPPHRSATLRYGDDVLGTIECGLPVDRAPVPDREMLDAIAMHAALAVHDLWLTAELRRRLGQLRDQSAELAASRARIVAAQEGERRRIERNLHDGAQQELVALIAKARLARVQLRQRPESTEATLVELQHDAQLALIGLRELAQGIHPTVLADRGLVEAIEDRTARLPIAVKIHADPSVRGSRFADAIEGAAFFAVSEALANVLKHAGIDRAEVRLRRVDGQLCVEVTDHGRGFDVDSVDSVGLPRLTDRIEALGGSLTVRSRAGAGTVVSARLPVRTRGDDDVA